LRFLETKIPGAFVIQPKRLADKRGYFARTFCLREFERRGFNPRVAQCSTSFNPRRGTLRGLHFQVAPHTETKLVRCTRGAIFDVLVDLRPDSPTYLQWCGVGLSESDGKSLYIPEGIAHGFQTLVQKTEVLYQISEFFHPEFSRGIRWDDPALKIDWPLEPTAISERDLSFPLISREDLPSGSNVCTTRDAA
jgi:dTDP-4-dehydrorhamnose 3,5-epimerase